MLAWSRVRGTEEEACYNGVIQDKGDGELLRMDLTFFTHRAVASYFDSSCTP